MNNRMKFVKTISEKFLSNIGHEFDDPQMYELLKGISLLHASKKYEDSFALEQAINNIQYNVESDFELAPHGLIKITPKQLIEINKNFVFRSGDSIYKTIDAFNINIIDMLNIQEIQKYNQRFLEIKIQGLIKNTIEFFTHIDVIDEIFQNKDEIIAHDFNGDIHRMKKITRGNVFENKNCPYITSFIIDKIQDQQQITLYIPIENKINNLKNYEIYTNCIIVQNKFEIQSNPSKETVIIQDNITPIRFNKATFINGIEASHKRINKNGWHITKTDNTYFTNINTEITLSITCKNINPNTEFCQSEMFIPSTNLKWIIKPFNENLNIQSFDTNAFDIFKNLTSLCEIDYENHNVTNDIILKYHNNKPYYEYGTIIKIKLISKKFVFIKLIEEEINKYHNTKVILGEEE